MATVKSAKRAVRCPNRTPILIKQFYYSHVLLNSISVHGDLSKQTEQMTTNLTDVASTRRPLSTVKVRKSLLDDPIHVHNLFLCDMISVLSLKLAHPSREELHT